MTSPHLEERLAEAAVLSDLSGVVRPSLLEAHAEAWRWISGPGTWLDGPRRSAVVREVRNAPNCALCRERKEALSPFAVDGDHDSLGELTDVEVEAIHRLATDSGRLSSRWLDGLLENGLTDGEYIEIAGIVAMVTMMDAFAWAIDVAPSPDLTPRDGAPTQYRPPGAKKRGAWLPIVHAEDVVSSDGELYPDTDGGVHKALSLVPDSKRAFWALGEPHYIPMSEMRSFDTKVRAISRAQIEIIAERVSALHQCVY